MALQDQRERLRGEVALQGANGVELGVSPGDATGDERLGPLVGVQPPDGDDVQGAAGSAVAAAVEAVTDRRAGGCRHRAHAAQRRAMGQVMLANLNARLMGKPLLTPVI